MLSVVCLRAGKPGRPKKTTSDKKIAQVDPAYKLMYCGHCNDLCRVSKCCICDQRLVGKGGRLEETSTVGLSLCDCALIGNPGRLEVKLNTQSLLWSHK